MTSSLQSLITDATRYAEISMKNGGAIVPTMMAATDQGIMIFIPDNLRDTEAKDDFAIKVKLICASYNSSAVVLILESWVRLAKQGEKLDLTPPSESHDREEMVVLIGQSKQEHSTRMFPIVRLGNGKFWNLGDP